MRNLPKLFTRDQLGNRTPCLSLSASMQCSNSNLQISVLIFVDIDRTFSGHKINAIVRNHEKQSYNGGL
jgi:hypothetical protein